MVNKSAFVFVWIKLKVVSIIMYCCVDTGTVINLRLPQTRNKTPGYLESMVTLTNQEKFS